jgi:hypothetical protein
VGGVLRGLGLDQYKIASELAAMGPCTVTGTNDRRVPGSMNDFVRMLDAYLDGRPLVEVSLHLAEAPCSPLGRESPRRRTVALSTGPDLPGFVGPVVTWKLPLSGWVSIPASS